MDTNCTSNSSYYTLNSSCSTYLNDSSATSTFDPHFITNPREPIPNFLNEIHNFLDFAQFDPNLEDDSYIISRPCVTEETWDFGKGNNNNMDSTSLIASHPSPHQTLKYCSTNSRCFSPWVTPKNDGFMMTASSTPTKTEGQLLLKSCLLKLLPWMRDVKSSKYYLQAEVSPGSKMINCSKANTTSPASSGNQDEIAHNHMLAERTRRKKHNECLKVLQALLPKSTKKDKISVLKSTIEQLKELKACKENLENRMEELERTNATLKSLCISVSLSNRKLVRGSQMCINTNTNTNTDGSSSRNSSGDSTITSIHHRHQCSEEDIHHGRASVSINSARHSDNTFTMSILILARLTLGSNQLIKVLSCLKDLSFQVLLVESRFEGDMFMAQISARAEKDLSWTTEAQIQDVMVKALSPTEFQNSL